MKNYYILTDLNEYGDQYPVCVDEDEMDRLVMSGWDRDAFRDADDDDIETYGTYESVNY